MTLRILDPSRLSRVPMTAIIEHWTAGSYTANSTELGCYHVLTQGDGSIRYGVDIALNSGQFHKGYATHTSGGNLNRIGHAMCGMRGASENPWNPGSQPLTKHQWDKHVLAAADLCEFYSIAVTRDKLLFHAEVSQELGIPQKGKWDVTRLPFDDSVRGARAVGDKFRDEVLSALRGNEPSPLPKPTPLPALIKGTTGVTTALSLNFRRGAGIEHEITGSLAASTEITLLAAEGDWYQVRTSMGYEGWVHGGYVRLLNIAPDPNTGTIPSGHDAEAKVDSVLS